MRVWCGHEETWGVSGIHVGIIYVYEENRKIWKAKVVGFQLGTRTTKETLLLDYLQLELSSNTYIMVFVHNVYVGSRADIYAVISRTNIYSARGNPLRETNLLDCQTIYLTWYEITQRLTLSERHSYIMRVPRVPFVARSRRYGGHNVVVLLKRAANGGGEPTRCREHVGEVHVLQIRLRIAPSSLRFRA